MRINIIFYIISKTKCVRLQKRNVKNIAKTKCVKYFMQMTIKNDKKQPVIDYFLSFE